MTYWKLLTLGAFGVLTVFNAHSNTCFESNKIIVKKISEQLANSCKRDFGVSVNRLVLSKSLSEKVTGTGVDCFNSCQKNETSESCVERFADSIVEGFMQATDMKVACNRYK